jgi:hypothetical protein
MSSVPTQLGPVERASASRVIGISSLIESCEITLFCNVIVIVTNESFLPHCIKVYNWQQISAFFVLCEC